jgi:heme exporter protein C
MVFFFAPLEAVMGAVQRVFYFHVSTGWVGMLAFLLAAAGGFMYLRTRSMEWDILQVAAVEVGLVFMSACIVSGSIWARPIWNTWWTWDPRLTTVTVMGLIYAAYLMLRRGIDDPERRARFASVYAIVGFLSVPMTFLSIRIFRTIHPVVVAGNTLAGSAGFDMTARMQQTLLFSVFAFTVLFADLMCHRTRLGRLSAQIEARSDIGGD